MVLGPMCSSDLIGLCCQILLDEEGAYYISSKFVRSIKTRLTIKIEHY